MTTLLSYFREHTVDLLGGVFPGLRPVPKPVASHFNATGTVHGQLLDSIPAVVPNNLGSVPVLKSRMLGTAFRMGYTLRAERKGKIEYSQGVGRSWDVNWAWDPEFVACPEYGSGVPTLHPALAPLANEVMDRHALQALTNISRVFSEVRPGQLSTTARAAIRTLPKEPANHVRYLQRLASLYLAAAAVENQGGTLHYYGGKAADREPERLGVTGVAALNRLLDYGLSGRRNVIYFENSALGAFSADLSRILRIAAHSDPDCRSAVGYRPAVLSLWPEVRNSLYAELIPENAVLPEDEEVGAVPAAAVWEAATSYCRQHNLMGLWDEMVHTAAFWCWRPSGDCGLAGFTKIILGYPEARMTSGALGPLLASARSWAAATEEAVELTLAEYAAAAVVRYGLVSAGLTGVLLNQGLLSAYYSTNASTLWSTLNRLCVSRNSPTPILHRVAAQLAAMGAPKVLGRTLAYISFGLSKASAGPLVRGPTNCVQWEELLPAVDIFPASSSIYGTLKPLSMVHPTYGRWASVEMVADRAGEQDAFYSLAATTALSYGMATVYHATGLASITAYAPPTCYSGRPADNAFPVVQVMEGAHLKPVFKLETAEAAFSAAFGARRRADWTWYIDWEEDGTFEGMLASMATPPTDMQPAPQGTHAPGMQPAPAVAPSGELPPQQPRGRVPLPSMASRSKADKLASVFGDIPEWVEKIMEVESKLGDTTVQATLQTRLREAGNLLDNWDQWMYLTITPFEDRPAIAKNLGYFARKGLEFGTTLGSVNVEGFATMVPAFDNIAASTQVCPAVTAEELAEFNPNPPSDLTTDALQAGIAAGLPIGEMAQLPTAERMRRVEAAAELLRQTVADAAALPGAEHQHPALRDGRATSSIAAPDFGASSSSQAPATPGGPRVDIAMQPSGLPATAQASQGEGPDVTESPKHTTENAAAADTDTGVRLEPVRFEEASADPQE
jgi:hypothetical protein